MWISSRSRHKCRKEYQRLRFARYEFQQKGGKHPIEWQSSLVIYQLQLQQVFYIPIVNYIIYFTLELFSFFLLIHVFLVLALAIQVLQCLFQYLQDIKNYLSDCTRQSFSNHRDYSCHMLLFTLILTRKMLLLRIA